MSLGGHMRKNIVRFLLLSVLFFYLPSNVSADPSEKYILQQYLTIVEVERDLVSVQEEQQLLEKEIKVNETKVKDQEVIVGELRKKGAKILREYYTGERLSWISMVLSMETFHNGILVIEYLYEIFDRDMNELQIAYEQYQSLLRLQQQLDDQHLDVMMLKNHYTSQKKRLLGLEQQLNTSLSNIPEKERLQQLMAQLEKDWVEKGQPAFYMFFNQLASAMEKFPEYINKNNVSLKGTNPKVTITDKELNSILVEENELFKNLTFTFKENQLWAQGVHEGAALTLIGNYKLVNDKKLDFFIESMTYDGFYLPDSTIKNMEKSIDLGFYPTYIHPNIRVKSFSMNDHTLSLELKFTLKD